MCNDDDDNNNNSSNAPHTNWYSIIQETRVTNDESAGVDDDEN